MEAEKLKEQREEGERQKVRRTIRRVDNSAQLPLYEVARRAEEKVENEERVLPKGLKESRQYRNPSPEGILVGGEKLKSFLEGRGERKIVAFRELLFSLDLEGFECEKARTGRRPYHPAALIGLILLGTLEGKSSLRELEQLAKIDARAWWLTGGIQPDHASIGRFIQSYSEALSVDFFLELTQKVLKLTGSRGGDLSGDGTVMEAACSAYKAVKVEAAEQAAREAEEAARKAPEDRKLERQSEHAKKVAQAARQRKEARVKNWEKGEVGVSPSDPEAVIQPLKKGGKAPSYKPVVLSNEDQVIVSQTVDPSCEHRQLDDLLQQATESSGKIGKLRLDSSFFNFEVLETVQEQGGDEKEEIDLYCPEGRTTPEGVAKGKKTKRYHKSQFRYDVDGDYYECPAGQHLVPAMTGSNKGRKYTAYGKAPCQECPQRINCTQSKNGRRVKRYQGEAAKDALRAKMKLPSSQQEYRKRALMEIIFARIKVHLGLQRFKRRGLPGVQVEFALAAAAYNVARWWALKPDLEAFRTLFKAIIALFEGSMGSIRPHPLSAVSFR